MFIIFLPGSSLLFNNRWKAYSLVIFTPKEISWIGGKEIGSFIVVSGCVIISQCLAYIFIFLLSEALCSMFFAYFNIFNGCCFSTFFWLIVIRKEFPWWKKGQKLTKKLIFNYLKFQIELHILILIVQRIPMEVIGIFLYVYLEMWSQTQEIYRTFLSNIWWWGKGINSRTRSTKATLLSLITISMILKHILMHLFFFSLQTTKYLFSMRGSPVLHLFHPNGS